MDIHRSKKIVATGEASINPEIHIFDATNQKNLRIINTFHKTGILMLKFSTQ